MQRSNLQMSLLRSSPRQQTQNNTNQSKEHKKVESTLTPLPELRQADSWR